MSIATTSRELSARVSDDKQRIVLRTFGDPAMIEFARSLPSSRWHAKYKVWTCDLTPIAAWRVGSKTCELCPELEEPAKEVGARLQRARGIREGTKPLGDSPPTKLPAWRHQRVGFAFASALGSAMLACDMGVGKSMMAVGLIRLWECQRTLILCPKSVLPVWSREFKKHYPADIEVVVLSKGTVAKKAAVASDRLGNTDARPVAIIINYESAWRKLFADLALSQQWDAIVLDESHRIKSHASSVSKFCAKLGKQTEHRLCLTGTPMPHSPLDLFGQFRFLDPAVFGTSWVRFRSQYARLDNPAIPQMVTGWQNEAELQEKFALLTYRVEARDVLDLPPATHHERTCELGLKARKAYHDLHTELIAEVDAGTVTAANTMVRVTRLQQVTSGFVVLEGDKYREEEIDYEKEKLLIDLLKDIQQGDPVVV
ncbi:MAG: SNF2-related protein, partial [Planctomycetota bacterium]